MFNEQGSLKVKERDTLPLQVCNILREAILRGDFAGGQRLVQSKLAETLGVSRMPIREALKTLEEEGLIINESHRGAVVKPITLKDIEEIYELRAVLEAKAIRLSVPDLTEDEIASLEELLQSMEKTEDANEFIQLNNKFHRILVSHCPWERLSSFIDKLWKGFPQQTPHIITGQIDKSKDEHRLIFDAVKQKDAGQAASVLEAHIQRTGKTLVENLIKDKKASPFSD